VAGVGRPHLKQVLVEYRNRRRKIQWASKTQRKMNRKFFAPALPGTPGRTVAYPLEMTVAGDGLPGLRKLAETLDF